MQVHTNVYIRGPHHADTLLRPSEPELGTLLWRRLNSGCCMLQPTMLPKYPRPSGLATRNSTPILSGEGGSPLRCHPGNSKPKKLSIASNKGKT